MQFFYWLVFVIAVGVAIFAVQNSSAPPVDIKFLIWGFKTSLVYTILGSIALGILFTLLIWIPRAVRAAFRSRKSDRPIQAGQSPA
ncbi:MAG TPA: lipopolysaccharide assembly protein LapA domain-containing protein [Thermodesulfobacteriota bacterium]|nr:lipopolysaccharide assembly protein LapA domain-containing protein [Thermodesulfobacteriota bacterium]